MPLGGRQAAQESALRRDRGESKFADKRRAGRREGDRVAPTVGGVLVATDHSTLDKGFDIGADVAAIPLQAGSDFVGRKRSKVGKGGQHRVLGQPEAVLFQHLFQVAVPDPGHAAG